MLFPLVQKEISHDFRPFHGKSIQMDFSCSPYKCNFPMSAVGLKQVPENKMFCKMQVKYYILCQHSLRICDSVVNQRSVKLYCREGTCVTEIS